VRRSLAIDSVGERKVFALSEKDRFSRAPLRIDCWSAAGCPEAMTAWASTRVYTEVTMREAESAGQNPQSTRALRYLLERPAP
jgi:hypothetical protein